MNTCEKLNTTKMKSDKEKIHIGKIIKSKLEEKNMSISQLAKGIHCERQNVYNIFKRKSIDIDLLRDISLVLEYDFITEIYAKPSSRIRSTFSIEIIDGTKIHIIEEKENDG